MVKKRTQDLIRILAVGWLALLVILSASKSLGYGHWAWGGIVKTGVRKPGSGLSLCMTIDVYKIKAQSLVPPRTGC